MGQTIFTMVGSDRNEFFKALFETGYAQIGRSSNTSYVTSGMRTVSFKYILYFFPCTLSAVIWFSMR